MTTFAHIGGGIAVAATVQQFVFKEEITPSTILVGMVFGLLPDLDSIFAFLFGKWSPGSQMLSHHRYFSHTPLFFILVSGCIWLIVDWKLAFLFFAITMTHLLMDSWSTDDGVMWFWPVNSEQFSILKIDMHIGGIYGIPFYVRYIKTPSVILPELVIIFAGAFVIIRAIVQRN
ncbi:MAG: metal-dependent hydrolase [Anaerolineales bacterium]|jgi:hypothetical protein